jgi:hypothetical protein
MSNYLVYDCEILADPNLVGWRNFEALGISVIGAYASWLHDPLCFFDNRSDDYLVDFQALVNVAIYRNYPIVGFNSIEFDDRLCQAHGVNVKTDVDLLRLVRVLSGQPAIYVRGLTRAGYNLDAICRANGLGVKSGHGADMPDMWAAGDYDTVVSYCLNDVSLTQSLYQLWLSGSIIDPVSGAVLSR